MSERSEVIRDLATRVAEGRPIDWRGELAAHPDLRDQIENLRGVSELASELEERRNEPSASLLEGPDAISAALASRCSGRPGEPTEAQGNELGTWGHLRLVAELGAGSFGTVYRAFDPVLQREVALKLRHRGPDSESARARSFIDEARRLARLRHPHVLGVHGADVHDGRVGLWAELLPGTTLEDELEAADAPTLERVLVIGEALTSALRAVHAAGLVHGDVKASNVAIDDGRRPVLVDFGAGVDLRAEKTPKGVFGSPLSLAPERLAGDPLQPSVDLYGLGVLLFRLLNGGRYPVEAESLDDLLAAHDEGRPASIRWSRPGVRPRAPRALRRLVESLLDRDPERRPSAEQALDRLQRIARAPARRRLGAAVAMLLASLVAGTVLSTAAYLRARAAQTETEAINTFLADMLAAPRSVASGRQVRVVDVLDDAVESVDSLAAGSAARIRVQQLLGETYLALGRPRAAEPLLRAVAELRVERQGPTSAAALRARAYWADALMQSGSASQAREIAEQVAGAGDPSRPRSFGTGFAEVLLARLERDEARYADAESRLRTLLARLPEGDDDPERVRYLAENDLATLLMESGRHRDALPVLEPRLEELQRSRGMRHADTLTTANLLGICLTSLGEYDRAAELFREVAETAAGWLGDDHSRTLAARTNLAAALKESGRLPEALEIEQALLPVVTAVKGSEAPETLSLRTNLCLTLRQTGRHAEAELCSAELAPILRETLGANHPVTLIHAVNHAELLLEADRARLALELASTTRTRMTETFGAESPVLLVVDTIVGAAQADLGERAAGLSLLRRTLAAQRKTDGPADLQTLTTQLRLGAALCGRESSSSAERAEGATLVTEALELARPAFADGHPLLRELEQTLARCAS